MGVLAFLEGPELIIVVVVVFFLFGAKKLPEFARSLGQAKKEFEKGIDTPAESSTQSVSQPVQPVNPAPIAQAPVTPPPAAPAEGSVTMSKAEYVALMAERARAAAEQQHPN
jgi:sec-independent protein translocase protein TatA